MAQYTPANLIKLPEMSEAEGEIQLQSIGTLIERLQDQCFRKCITYMPEDEMTTGESTCIKNCAAKYLNAYELVGQRYRKYEQDPYILKNLASQGSKEL